jgi:hypothetical protein
MEGISPTLHVCSTWDWVRFDLEECGQHKARSRGGELKIPGCDGYRLLNPKKRFLQNE